MLQPSFTGTSGKVEVLDHSTTPFQQVVASCSGALLTSLFTTPLDVVKVRLQKQVRVAKWAHRRIFTPLDVIKVRLQAQNRQFNRCFIYSNGLMDHLCTCSNVVSHTEACPWYLRPSKFSGTWDAFVKIVRHEGVRSLWSGLSPTLVMAVPATVCYFTAYDNLNQALRQQFGSSYSLSMLAGATARFGVVTLVSPFELIRTKMQSEKLSLAGVGKMVRGAVRDVGLRALFIGWNATILRDVPFSAIYWGCYESCKERLMIAYGLSHATFGVSFLSGAVSGTIAAVVTLPFDVVKTHKQIELGEMNMNRDILHKSNSAWSIAKQLYYKHGASALFAGAVPRIIKVAPACAIMIGSYEYFKALFYRRNQRLGTPTFI